MRKALLGVVALCSIAFGSGRAAHAADGAYIWATGNGATYAEELTPLAQAAARGEVGMRMDGYVIFAAGRAGGAESAEQAISMLSMLSAPPKAGFLVAVGTSFDGSKYSVGYVVAVRPAPETTTPEPVATAPATATSVKKPVTSDTTPATTAPQQPQSGPNSGTATTTTVAVTPNAGTETVPSSIASSTTQVPTTTVSTTISVLDTGGTSNGASVLAENRTVGSMSIHGSLYFIIGMLIGHFGVSRLIRGRR